MSRKTIHIEVCVSVELELVAEEKDGDVTVVQILNAFSPSPRRVMESMCEEDWQALENYFKQ